MTGELANANQLLMVGAILLSIGIVGMLARRDFLMFLISSQVVLQGICLSLSALNRIHPFAEGTAWLFLLLGFAVIQAIWGIALATALRFRDGSLDVSRLRVLGETDSNPATDPSCRLNL